MAFAQIPGDHVPQINLMPMKRSFADRSLFLLLVAGLFMLSGQVAAQVKVTRISSSDGLSGKNGVVYALPRTILGVDLAITKVQHFPGPLAEYAREFLGIGDPLVKATLEYRIDGAFISPACEPDPAQTFIVEKEDKSQGEVWVNFSPDGRIVSMESFAKESSPKGFSAWKEGLYTPLEEAGLYSKYSASAVKEVIDTIIRKVSIDTLMIEQMTLKRSMVEYPDRDKAEEAMDKIRQIDSDIYNLLIGYQETPYSREALEFMYEKLRAEKQEYVSLFTGVTVEERLVFHYNIVPDPDKEVQVYEISGFSVTSGMVAPAEDNKVTLTITRENKPVSGPGSGQYTGGIVYRIPATLPVSLNYGEKELASGLFEIKQLGSLLSLPPQFKKFELDLTSGMLRTLVLE